MLRKQADMTSVENILMSWTGTHKINANCHLEMFPLTIWLWGSLKGAESCCWLQNGRSSSSSHSHDSLQRNKRATSFFSLLGKRKLSYKLLERLTLKFHRNGVTGHPQANIRRKNGLLWGTERSASQPMSMEGPSSRQGSAEARTVFMMTVNHHSPPRFAESTGTALFITCPLRELATHTHSAFNEAIKSVFKEHNSYFAISSKIKYACQENKTQRTLPLLKFELLDKH